MILYTQGVDMITTTVSDKGMTIAIPDSMMTPTVTTVATKCNNTNTTTHDQLSENRT